MVAGKWTTNYKNLENPMLRGYLVSKAHKNKIPTAIPTFSGLTFSMAIIFTLPDVAITSEINMAENKAEVVSVWQMLLTSRRRNRMFYGMWKTLKLDTYCWNLLQVELSRWRPQPEVISVLHIMFTAFACRRSQVQCGCGAFSPPSWNVTSRWILVWITIVAFNLPTRKT